MKVFKSSKCYVAQWSECFTTEMDVAACGKHHPSAITFASKAEVIGHIANWVKYHPSYVFRVYETIGGIRVFCLSHSMQHYSPLAAWLHKQLRGDPHFGMCFYNAGFNARISKKAIYGDSDYISKRILTLGSGKVLPELELVCKQYEELVMEGRKNSHFLTKLCLW